MIHNNSKKFLPIYRQTQPQPQPDADLIWHMDFTSGLYQPYSQITGTNGDSNNYVIQNDNTMGSYLHCTKTTHQVLYLG